LRTALNLVDYNKFISVDKANLSDVTVLTKTQSSVKSKPDNFNLDVVSDLLYGVTGGIISDNPTLGNIITGNDGINLLPKINFNEIPNILKKVKIAYESDRYKEHFDWVDNLKEVKDLAKINILKLFLIDKLKEKNKDVINLAPPYIIDWSQFEGYAFTGTIDELKFDFDIEEFYVYKSNKITEIDWDSISKQKIYLKFSNYDYRTSNSLLRFINFEIVINNEIFVFSLGKWYQINSNYIQEIKEYVSDIEESDVNFIDYVKTDKLSEEDYNIVFAGSSIHLALFDQNLIKSEYMNRSNIELCDVLSLDKKELIHIKFRYSSATLSHLFAQGKISAYALIRDRSFRKNCRAKLSSMGLDYNLVTMDGFKPSEYTITFALIDKKDRLFVDALPFFSLINFRLTIQTLKEFGFKVKVKNIKMI
jgi:uncharacterized protein (TIGR04141 family)